MSCLRSEVILTCGHSGTLVEFLKAAIRKNKNNSFEVRQRREWLGVGVCCAGP